MERQIIGESDLLTNTEFYAWLNKEHAAGNTPTHFIDAILKYFGKAQPFKNRSDGSYHKYVYQSFWLDKQAAAREEHNKRMLATTKAWDITRKF